jgi:hypothetical protein
MLTWPFMVKKAASTREADGFHELVSR